MMWQKNPLKWGLTVDTRRTCRFDHFFLFLDWRLSLGVDLTSEVKLYSTPATSLCEMLRWIIPKWKTLKLTRLAKWASVPINSKTSYFLTKKSTLVVRGFFCLYVHFLWQMYKFSMIYKGSLNFGLLGTLSIVICEISMMRINVALNGHIM